MLGAGAVNKGDILIGSGTCWVVVATSDKPNFETGLSQSVAAIPGMWGSLKSPKNIQTTIQLCSFHC